MGNIRTHGMYQKLKYVFTTNRKQKVRRDDIVWDPFNSMGDVETTVREFTTSHVCTVLYETQFAHDPELIDPSEVCGTRLDEPINEARLGIISRGGLLLGISTAEQLLAFPELLEDLVPRSPQGNILSIKALRFDGTILVTQEGTVVVPTLIQFASFHETKWEVSFVPFLSHAITHTAVYWRTPSTDSA